MLYYFIGDFFQVVQLKPREHWYCYFARSCEYATACKHDDQVPDCFVLFSEPAV